MRRTAMSFRFPKHDKLVFGGQRNGTPSGMCVGNAFMRSETLDNLRGLLNGNFPRHIFEVLPFNTPILKQECAECLNVFPTNHPPFSHSMYCLKRRYLAECINAFPTQNWTFRFKMLPQKRYRAGNGVTITANPGASLPAGATRQIQICPLLRQGDLCNIH